MNLGMIKKLSRFLTSGALAAAIEYGVFVLLFSILGFGVFVANSVSFGCGFLVSFLLNRHWVFKSKNGAIRELTKYAILAVINLGLSNIILYLMTDMAHINGLIAKFLVMGLIAVWNYVIFSRFIFGDKTKSSL